MASRGKVTSASRDASAVLRSASEIIMRIPSLPEGDKGLLGLTNYDELAEEEAKDFDGKKFVKLKRDHWVDPRSRSSCLICKKFFGLTSKKLNYRRYV